MNLQDDIEQQIKELDRDKRIEELRRLRASSKTKWISPTVLALLLPLLGGSGLWIVGELKQYSEAYEALAEQDAFEREKDALQAQKDSLNAVRFDRASEDTVAEVTARITVLVDPE